MKEINKYREYLESIKDKGEFDYEILPSNTIRIKSLNLYKTDIVIPSHIDGLPVTHIGESFSRDSACFGLWESEINLTLPDTITHIEMEAFALVTINLKTPLPKSLKFIGEYGLHRLYIDEIPESVEYIGSRGLKNDFVKQGNKEVYICDGLCEVLDKVEYDGYTIRKIKEGGKYTFDIDCGDKPLTKTYEEAEEFREDYFDC